MRMFLNLFFIPIVFFALFSAQAAAETTIYGAVKMSVDSFDDGQNSHTSVSSNSSRFGLKGSEDIGGEQKAIWKLEAGIDASGETGSLGVRNRYVGLEGGYGQIILGAHDTPFKKVRGKAAIFSDTIGDSRTIMGTQTGAKNQMDKRAKNIVQYQTPKMFGLLQGKLMYSAGNHDSTVSENGADDQSLEITSFSLGAKSGALDIGLAWENQSTTQSSEDDKNGLRLAASYKMGDGKVGLAYESLDAGENNILTRNAYLMSYQQKINQGTVGFQYASAEDYDGSSDTGASYAALGYTHKLAKTTSVYIMYAMTDNADNAQFGGAASGHDTDKFKAAGVGEDPSAISLGLVQKF